MKLVRTFLLITSAMALILLAGCKSGGTNGKSPKPEDITDTIKQQVTLSTMTPISPDRLPKWYNFSTDSLESQSVYFSSAGTADEIAVFKAKSADEASKIETAVKSRISDRATLFKAYNPAEYEKLKKSLTETKGNYVFYAVCTSPDDAKKNI